MQHYPAWKQHEALFATAIPDVHRHELSAPELAQLIADSLAEKVLFPREETIRKRVPQLVIFTYLCAPRVASRQGLVAAAEFLYIFFLFNDHWAATGAVFVEESTSMPVDHRVTFVREWLALVRRRFGPKADRFLSSFRLYHASLCVEATYADRPGHPTWDEYVDKRTGRYQWVATSPYIDLWELVEGIEVPDAEREATDQLKELGVELTYLANDIGSIQRDSNEKNYIRLLLAKMGSSLPIERGLEEALRIYREKARAFMLSSRDLQSRELLSSYADMVANVTDGNLLATTLLAESAPSGRYSPAVSGCLESLPRVCASRPGIEAEGN